MREWLANGVLFLPLVPLASAHGDLDINELETLIIRDFEGQEDSFAWEGWDIWDVYVGEGYNDIQLSEDPTLATEAVLPGLSPPASQRLLRTFEALHSWVQHEHTRERAGEPNSRRRMYGGGR